MLKLNKTQARKFYNMGGVGLIIVPCNCSYMSSIARTIVENCFERLADIDFDTFVNTFEYYNCNSELGRYAHFYVEENKYFNK